MRRHATEEGLSVALMGSEFTPDEMGRIEKTEMQRRQLSQNGPEVFRSAVNVLKDARKKESMQKGDLNERLAYLREKQAKLHKGKAETK